MSSEEVEYNNGKKGNKKKNNTTKNIVILVVVLAIIVGIIVLLINLFTPKSTYTSTGDETTSTESLYCTTKSLNIDGAFFDVSDAVAGSQAIKVLFKNKKIDNISYNASLTYSDNENAIREEAKLHTRYGLYINDSKENSESLSSNFAIDGTGVRVNIYSNDNKLNATLAKIFLIDTTDSELNSYTSRVLSTLYKSKGFSCESKE